MEGTRSKFDLVPSTYIRYNGVDTPNQDSIEQLWKTIKNSQL